MPYKVGRYCHLPHFKPREGKSLLEVIQPCRGSGIKGEHVDSRVMQIFVKYVTL